MSNIRMIFKNGHSAAVTIPKQLALEAKVGEGDLVIFAVEEIGKLTMRVIKIENEKKKDEVENARKEG